MFTTIARRFLAVLEPIATTPFFARETQEEMGRLGLDFASGYFCARAAPMGRVSAGVVSAAFYNFNPAVVTRSLRWDIAAPEDVLEARVRAARAVLERLLEGGNGMAAIERACVLLEQATAACGPAGRPLYAANAALAAPDDPAARLWHFATCLREYRGDGHVAVLVSQSVGPIEALCLHAPFREIPLERLLRLRQWSPDEAADAIAALVERGILTAEGSLTDGGWKLREMIERDTDRLAAPAFRALGEEGCEDALALLEPFGRRIVEQKGVPRGVVRAAGGAGDGRPAEGAADGSATGTSATDGR